MPRRALPRLAPRLRRAAVALVIAAGLAHLLPAPTADAAPTAVAGLAR